MDMQPEGMPRILAGSAGAQLWLSCGSAVRKRGKRKIFLPEGMACGKAKAN